MCKLRPIQIFRIQEHHGINTQEYIKKAKNLKLTLAKDPNILKNPKEFLNHIIKLKKLVCKIYCIPDSILLNIVSLTNTSNYRTQLGNSNGHIETLTLTETTSPSYSTTSGCGYTKSNSTTSSHNQTETHHFKNRSTTKE
ncbi:hypothetical protein ACTFIZ_004871 [Dictyostelium cf. discoideum]